MMAAMGALLVVATLPATLELLLTVLGVLFFKSKPLPSLKSPLPKTVILIPAHNESYHLRQTLRSIQSCASVFDVAVIADNCTDETSAIARSEKALLFERNSTQRGKHYALNYAFSQLPEYDLYIIIDADTLVQPNLVEVFQKHFQKGSKAIQALYLLPPVGNYPSSRLASIAFAAFNALRPMGRSTWNLSCGLYGNGVGLAGEVTKGLTVSTETLVEDVAYHLDLVKRGIRVDLAPETKVVALHPESTIDASKQQQRWQGGRLRLWCNQAPELLKKIAQGNWMCLEPFLELCTPPLAYYTIALIIISFTSLRLYAIFGFLVLAALLIQTLWFRKEGYPDLLALASIPVYLLKRLFALGQIWKGSKKDQTWDRTKRKGE